MSDGDLRDRMQRDRFFGKHRGFVRDNADPERLGRVRVAVPSVLGEETTGWALPCLPFGGLADQGQLMTPEVGARIWVEFEEGDLSRPIWTGVFWQPASPPPRGDRDSDEPTARLIRTPSGHALLFEDAGGEERVALRHASGAALDIDPDGTVALTDANGARLTLDAEAGKVVVEDANGASVTLDSAGVKVADAAGNEVELAGAGVTVKGAQIVIDGQMVALGGSGGEPVLKGQSFLTFFMTHTHPTAVGPSGPPIPQGEASALSMKVTTS